MSQKFRCYKKSLVLKKQSTKKSSTKKSSNKPINIRIGKVIELQADNHNPTIDSGIGDPKIHNFYTKYTISNNKDTHVFVFGCNSNHYKNRAYGGSGQAAPTKGALNVVPINTMKISNTKYVDFHQEKLERILLEFLKKGGNIVFPMTKTPRKDGININIGTGKSKLDTDNEEAAKYGRKFADKLLKKLKKLKISNTTTWIVDTAMEGFINCMFALENCIKNKNINDKKCPELEELIVYGKLRLPDLTDANKAIKRYIKAQTNGIKRNQDGEDRNGCTFKEVIIDMTSDYIKKKQDYIWYIFPQPEGHSYSKTSIKYNINDEETIAFLQNEKLRENLKFSLEYLKKGNLLSKKNRLNKRQDYKTYLPNDYKQFSSFVEHFIKVIEKYKLTGKYKYNDKITSKSPVANILHIYQELKIHQKNLLI